MSTPTRRDSDAREKSVMPSFDRRANDPRVEQLVKDVADLKVSMVQNTEITVQVRDVLASFRVIGSVAKWITAIFAAIAAAYLAFKTGVDIANHK
jgi:hypothetical protein